jgi:FMNH2-dependent dimethyl sulfone monooxygenase
MSSSTYAVRGPGGEPIRFAYWVPNVSDGFKTNLIGTPEQIAERIVHLKTIGVDLVLTAFLHFQEEVEYFGKLVLPIVRELEQQRALVAA